MADTCPSCGADGKPLSDAPEHGVTFTVPLCVRCRDREIRNSCMDDFDIAYERARALGWED